MNIPDPWGVAIAGYLEFEQAAGATPQTIRTHHDRLAHMARRIGIDPWEVTPQQLIAWFGAQTQWAPRTRRGRRATFRTFWEWAVTFELTTRNPARALPLTRRASKVVRRCPDAVYRAGLARADERTTLILRLAHDAGLRRTEIAELRAADVFEDLDGWSVRVRGKGQKERDVPLTRRLAFDLRAHIEQGAVWIFPGDMGGHLSPRWVGKLATMALPGEWTLHTLRHSLATRAYIESDFDIVAVQEMLGHSNISTTRHYIDPPKSNVRRAIDAADRAMHSGPRRVDTVAG